MAYDLINNGVLWQEFKSFTESMGSHQAAAQLNVHINKLLVLIISLSPVFLCLRCSPCT
jgi:hypothetical protein